ncbi:PCI domain-containing protein [Perkinsela sp. CCAP 1560/4]|nr:PCI domain-containing protein [Perkinsela sp. CCAP 1560/4]|eukprot:KNH05881.1 PCI domain-containing protein [Perkinsela sp. CCAP 1560/4]
MSSEHDSIKHILQTIEGENGPRLYSYLQSLEKLVSPSVNAEDLQTSEQKDMVTLSSVLIGCSPGERERYKLWIEFLSSLIKTIRMKQWKNQLERFQSACTTFIKYDPVFRMDPKEKFGKNATRRNWQIPVLVFVLKHVKQSAFELSAHMHCVEFVQELARCSRNIIMYCQNVDSDVEVSFSRFKAIPFIVNTLLLVLISFYQTDQCRSFILAVEAMQKQGKTFLDCATRAQYAVYQFYLGRVRLLDRNFKGAREVLHSAFTKLPIRHPNKSIALYYCTFASLVCGIKPSESLLRKYELETLSELISALETGDYKGFERFCVENKADLIERGVFVLIPYLMLELNINAFKRCYYLSQQIGHPETSRIPIECLTKYQSIMGTPNELCSEDIVMDTVSNILASKRALGYLSREHKIVVLSKTNPFPPIDLS